MFKLIANLLGAGEKASPPEQTRQPQVAATSTQNPEPDISQDQLALMTAAVNASPDIRLEQRQRVIDHLCGKNKLFQTDDYLGLEEKRARGLNTRLKLHRDLTVVLSEAGMKVANPSAVLKEMGLASFMNAQKMEHILKYRVSGVTKGVRITACNVSRDKPCAWSKSAGRKVLPANAQTECDRRAKCDVKPYCMGYYEAVLSDI